MILPPLLATSGSAQSGKNLFLELLYKELKNYNISFLSFAEQLRRDCAVFLESQCDVIDPFNIPNKEEIRPFFVWYAEFKRKKNPEHWVQCLEKRMHFLKQNNISKHFFISDLRYYNEVEFIKKHNGLLIFIDKYKIENNMIVYNPPANEVEGDRKSTRLNSSHLKLSRMPSSA